MPKSTSSIFQPEVVQANLHDQLTAEQIQMLRRSVFVYQNSSVQLYIIGFLAFACVVITLRDWSIWLCMGGMEIFGTALVVDWVLKSWQDTRPGQIIQVTGRVLGTYHTGRYSDYYHISIKRPDGIDSTIYAQKQEARLFKKGKSYTFFYAQRTRILLSAVEVA